VGECGALDAGEPKVPRTPADVYTEWMPAPRCVQVMQQLDSAEAEAEAGARERAELALVVDGRALGVLLGEPAAKARMLALGTRCAAVVCCRVSPLQKALVTRLVRCPALRELKPYKTLPSVNLPRRRRWRACTAPAWRAAPSVARARACTPLHGAPGARRRRAGHAGDRRRRQRR